MTYPPPVQAHVSRVQRYACLAPNGPYKRSVRKRYRRVAKRATARFKGNLELWYSETYQTPMLTTRDLW